MPQVPAYQVQEDSHLVVNEAPFGAILETDEIVNSVSSIIIEILIWIFSFLSILHIYNIEHFQLSISNQIQSSIVL